MKLNKWFYLAALSFIWGSSFILIKKGLVGLTAIELGSIRIIISALVLIPFTFNRLKEISHKQWKWIIISAFVGSFFPAFLFAFAEQEIDSSVASILNSIVPLNTIIIGLVLFIILFVVVSCFPSPLRGSFVTSHLQSAAVGGRENSAISAGVISKPART